MVTTPPTGYDPTTHTIRIQGCGSFRPEELGDVSGLPLPKQMSVTGPLQVPKAPSPDGPLQVPQAGREEPEAGRPSMEDLQARYLRLLSKDGPWPKMSKLSSSSSNAKARGEILEPSSSSGQASAVLSSNGAASAVVSQPPSSSGEASGVVTPPWRHAQPRAAPPSLMVSKPKAVPGLVPEPLGLPPKAGLVPEPRGPPPKTASVPEPPNASTASSSSTGPVASWGAEPQPGSLRWNDPQFQGYFKSQRDYDRQVKNRKRRRGGQHKDAWQQWYRDWND